MWSNLASAAAGARVYGIQLHITDRSPARRPTAKKCPQRSVATVRFAVTQRKPLKRLRVIQSFGSCARNKEPDNSFVVAVIRDFNVQ
jgi:hypothetical protein